MNNNKTPKGFSLLKKKLPDKGIRAPFKRLDALPVGKSYAIISLAFLLLSSLYWSILSFRLQSGNADQLVNPYLLEHSATFHDAWLPGAHSLLLKWPVFYLIKVFGLGSAAFGIFTVSMALLTVAGLAAILYRIERRPLVFGSLCLALASALLLVPSVAYSGSEQPVNMAMLTMLNFEYLIYIAALALLIKSLRLRSWQFCFAVILLILLMASDRLFFDLSLGGGLLALLVYALRQGWNLVSMSVNWVLCSLLGALAALIFLWLLSAGGITHISGLSAGTPGGTVHSLHDLLLGIFYGVLGLATNLGANPAFDAAKPAAVTHEAWSRITGVSAISFLVNLAVLLFGLFAAWRLIRLSLAHNSSKAVRLDRPAKLSIMLSWSGLAAVFIFILSSHSYAVDARYLTIGLFAVFIGIAAYGRGRVWPNKTLLIFGLVFLVASVLGSITAWRTYNTDRAALSPVATRNQLIAEVMKQHPVKTLVGDYWRVLPIKQLSPNHRLNVTPLSGCFQAKETLSSQAWRPDLDKNSFAYLLTNDPSLAAHYTCTLDQVIAQYGRPNSSVLLAGSLDKPREMLLFYDRGAHKSAPKIKLKTPSTVLPVSLDELPYTTCSVPLTMNIVAHEDDDLLFMNPDLLHDIQAGHCVRTIYMTAGDAGAGQFYWLSRQQGSEAAYSKMLGFNGIWIDRIVQLDTHEYITISNPRGNPRISLIFLHLPDGNARGGGFLSTHFESLAKLENGQISTIHSVEGQSSYTSAQLVSVLTALMHTYQPVQIRTQANYISARFPDHSDHMAVGSFVKQAYAKYEAQQYEDKLTIPLDFYIGYPVHSFPANVAGSDLAQKMAAFFAYGQFDGGVCDSAKQCATTPDYSAYLPRQYQNDR